MNDPTFDDRRTAPPLHRTDAWLVRGIGFALSGLGLVGLGAVAWSRHAIDIGRGDPTLPIVCLVAGAAVTTLGFLRLR